jgi:hypothetical protein
MRRLVQQLRLRLDLHVSRICYAMGRNERINHHCDKEFFVGTGDAGMIRWLNSAFGHPRSVPFLNINDSQEA